MDWQDQDGTLHPDANGAEPSTIEAYEAPRVLRVSLRPAEAVLGHCKVSGAGGPVSSGSCGSRALPCRTPGS
jgi:hypothetical protein